MTVAHRLRAVVALLCLPLAVAAALSSSTSAATGDLVVSVEGSGQPVAQGGVAQYHVVITNHGVAPLGPVDAKVSFDAGLTGLSASSSSANVSCDATPGYACRIPTLAAGDSVYITVLGRVNANATGSARTTVTATGGGATASAQAENPIDATARPADVSISLASSSGGGHGATWMWRIVNHGPGAAPGTLFDEWGALGTNAVTRARASRGSCAITGPAGGGATIHCKLGTIPSGRAVTVTIFAPTYKETGISIVEHPSVASTVPDPHPQNNKAGAATKVPLRPRA